MKRIICMGLLAVATSITVFAQAGSGFAQALTLRHEGLPQDVVLQFSASTEGSDALDPGIDTPAPPFFRGVAFDARILADEGTAASDFWLNVVAAGVNRVFDFSLYSRAGGDVTVSWPSINLSVGNLALRLDGLEFDLSSADSMTVALAAGETKQGEVEFDRFGTVGVAQEEPADQASLMAYPNPFRSRVHLRFQTESPAEASVVVYNTLGERVALIHQGHLPAGPHAITWTPPGRLANGLYVIRVQAGTWTASHKALLLR